MEEAIKPGLFTEITYERNAKFHVTQIEGKQCDQMAKLNVTRIFP